MKHKMLPLFGLVFLLLPLAAIGQKPTGAARLSLSGDTITYVRSFPATITAPAGADFYLWSWPEGVKATSADNALTITAAPAGTHRITVLAVTVKIDFEKKAKEIVKDAGEVEINVGGVKPPEPPTPPAPTGLAKALKDACAASPGTAAEKADQMAKLAALYRQAPTLLEKVKTAGELQAVLLTARKALVPDTALLPVRQAIALEMAKVLPTDAAAPYGDPARAKALFATIEAALTEAMK